jgi:hypothetical protein
MKTMGLCVASFLLGSFVAFRYVGRIESAELGAYKVALGQAMRFSDACYDMVINEKPKQQPTAIKNPGFTKREVKASK